MSQQRHGADNAVMMGSEKVDAIFNQLKRYPGSLRRHPMPGDGGFAARRNLPDIADEGVNQIPSQKI
jgi:hypothetical protein